MQRKPLSAATLRRGLRPGLVGLGLLAVVLGAWALSAGNARDALRERAFDRLLPLLPRQTAGGPGVVIVDIDRATLARFGPWPWPRSRMAELVAAAAEGRPTALALDILFAGSDRFSPDGDAALAHALSAVPTVLGFVLETANSGQELPTTPVLSRRPVSLPGVWQANGVIGPIPVLANAAQGFGALVAAADPDGPIRRVPLLVMTGNMVRPGLAVETVRLAQEASALLIDPKGELIVGNLALPLGRDATLRLGGPPAAVTMSATRLIEEPAARAALAGRIVLIGSSAPEAGGLRVTPASPATPSVQIQAEAIAAIVRGEVLDRPVWAKFIELAGAALLGLICLLFAARLRPATAAVLALLVCLAWTAAAAAAVPGLALLLDPAGPPMVAIVTFAMATLARFVRDEWRARLLRLSFEQHLAPEVVRRIAADPAALRLRGEMREITALFTDIENFTSMTERAGPADLVALLDAYFDVATRIITDHGGMIDKIVGDAIHAIFNAPFELEDHPRRAVAAALALLQATEEVRRLPLGQRLALGRTRIGIETGPAIVGDVGGSRKLDYTAHGNAINAAARLEAANKDLGSAICIGPGTAARLDPTTVRQIGTLTVRGQSREISVYTPVSLAGTPTSSL
ncbi:MAG TPA: adenylate/guanylate cyclase domain-containing protein [Acetobacteraceae bacterium]